MRARSAAAGVPARGTRRDRLARALSEDWESTVVIAERAGASNNSSPELLEIENTGLAQGRTYDRGLWWGYEWRRGPRWESAYGGEG